MQDYASVIEKIHQDRPRVIFLSGKTCTGKTTLANDIRAHIHAGIIELDSIILGIDELDEDRRFQEIYRQRAKLDLIHTFVERAREAIDVMLTKHPVVLFEGAIANNETLAEIVAGEQHFLFIYLLPVDLEAYQARITSRFKQTSPAKTNGLPPEFWKRVDPRELKIFYGSRKISPALQQNITSYAIASMSEAKDRLAMFQQEFPDILVFKC